MLVRNLKLVRPHVGYANQVTRVLLDEVPLCGKKRTASLSSAVTGIDDGLRLNLTKAEVGDLPRVEVEEHGGVSGESIGGGWGILTIRQSQQFSKCAWGMGIRALSRAVSLCRSGVRSMREPPGLRLP